MEEIEEVDVVKPVEEVEVTYQVFDKFLQDYEIVRLGYKSGPYKTVEEARAKNRGFIHPAYYDDYVVRAFANGYLIDYEEPL